MMFLFWHFVNTIQILSFWYFEQLRVSCFVLLYMLIVKMRFSEGFRRTERYIESHYALLQFLFSFFCFSAVGYRPYLLSFWPFGKVSVTISSSSLKCFGKPFFRKRIVICAYLFRRFYHFDSVKRFFLSAFFVFIHLRSAYYRNKSTDIVYMYTRKLYVFFQTGRYKQNACYGIGKILFRMKVENGKW